MSSLVAGALLLTLSACGGGAGTGLVVVTVSSDGTVRGIDHLHVSVTNGGTSAAPVDFKPDKPFDLPPDQTFSLRFPSDRKGLVTINVVAFDAHNVDLAKGVGMGTLTPGARTTVSVLLPGVHSDGGIDGGLDGGSAPGDALTDAPAGDALDSAPLTVDAGSDDGGLDSATPAGDAGAAVFGPPAMLTGPLGPLLVAAPGDVWVVGPMVAGSSGPTLYHVTAAGTAASNDLLFTVTAIAGSGPRDVYVAGYSANLGRVARYDGTAWTTLSSALVDRAPLYALWTPGPGDVFVGGQGGSLLHSADGGGSWAALQMPSAQTIHAIWGTSDTTFYTGADSGELGRTGNGGQAFQVTVLDAQGPTVVSLWGSSARDVYALTGPGDVYHSTDGLTFPQSARLGVPGSLLWGSSAQDVYLAGGSTARGGVLLHSTGASFSSVLASQSPMVGLGGSGASDVWVADRGGDLFHGQ